MKNWLRKSRVIDARSAVRPSKKMRLIPRRRVNPAPSSEATIAAMACGRNMAP
jgi:hypothetical protein